MTITTPVQQPPVWERGWMCGARKQGTAGGNEPADCDWPTCGCDPYANKVIEALEEIGAIRDRIAEHMKAADRIVAVLIRARIVGGWDDDAVAADVLKALRLDEDGKPLAPDAHEPTSSNPGHG